MGNLWRKIKGSWINSFLFSCFLLAIFIGLFYLVNLDLKPGPKNTAVQQTPVSKDLDSEIKERLGSTEVSVENYSSWTVRYGLNESNNDLDQDPDGEGLPNYLEYIHGTNPAVSDTDGDGYTDKQEIANGYDPSAKEGNPKLEVSIYIEKLGIEAPMVWSASADEKSMLKDLENGVNHYPQTAAPGQNGNMVISGHSSNYIWAKGNYNHIFKDLNNLENGDILTVKTFQKNGRAIIYKYKVFGKYIDAPDDERIFEENENPTLTLSTCWPLGTNFKRLVIKAEIIK